MFKSTLFNFEYVQERLYNKDGQPSNFRKVYGDNGTIITCAKNSYHIVLTEELSKLGATFIESGYDVRPFIHRSGEIIGFEISFGTRQTKVGDCNYKLVLTVPNNGYGKGYLSIRETRLICTNGRVSNKTMHKDNFIKIPHTFDYKESLKLMEQSIQSFIDLLEQVEERNNSLNEQELSPNEVLFHLNKWFYEKELPKGQKTDLSLDEFRRKLAVEPSEVPSLARYEELKDAYNRELEYNKQLGLKLSLYTVYASVTNYLSRRVEKSQSKAVEVIKLERASKKLDYFDAL